MAEPLHDLNEALAEIEKMSIKTSQGTFVRVDDVKKVVRKRQEAAETAKEEERERLVEHGRRRPKNMVQAKQMILKDEELMKKFPDSGKRQLGKTIPAGPESPSRA